MNHGRKPFSIYNYIRDKYSVKANFFLLILEKIKKAKTSLIPKPLSEILPAFMEFLKPTKSKIIIFVILFFVFPVPVAYSNIGSCPLGGPITCDYGDVWKLMPLGGLWFIIALFTGGFQVFPFSGNIWEVLKIPYIIIIPYLMSCLIVEIYKKYKKQ